MNTKYSNELTHVINLGRQEAQRLHSAEVEPVHLLIAMLQTRESTGLNLLLKHGVDIGKLQGEADGWVQRHTVAAADGDNCAISRRTEKVLRLTMLESMISHSKEADTEHLLLAMMKERENEVCEMLTKNHISYSTFRGGLNVADDEEGEASSAPRDEKATAEPEKKRSGTPMLDSFGRDLTQAAQEGLLDPVVGRETEILRVSQILARRKKNNPILIGKPGVGKSAIVEGLAIRIVKRQVSRVLQGKRIVSLDMAAMVAGTKYRGQFEERIRNLVKEVQANKDVILFIDEIHTMVGAGSAAGTMDAANMLKPALARGGMQCIGATTIDEYRKSIEKDGALERRFQKVLVEPTSHDDTLAILQNLRERYEKHHNVRFTDEALEACVSLSERYITDRSFPDKAIDVLDESGARVHISRLPVNTRLEELEAQLADLGLRKQEEVRARNFMSASLLLEQSAEVARQIDEERKRWESELDTETLTVTDADVADVVSQIIGVPTQRINQSETQRLRSMRGQLQQAVVGQDDAIDRIVRAIQRSRVGLKDPDKPIGAFMFLGPTGVGKTFLTKKLAELMFGSKDALIRIDMSEFMEKHTVSRLVGAPPGYVGYEEGGQLTEQVRRHPYSIVLLDEIEKAHQDVFNILLQVMDEGRLTDNNGTTVDFKNTVIIMTSNCGTRQLKEFAHGIGFGAANGDIDNKAGRDVLQKALNRQFAPEFLNRLDDIVYFNRLSREDIIKMVDLHLAPLSRRVEAMGYHLSVDAEAKAFLADKGYDVQFGARPLARAVQTHIEDAICELVMAGDLAPGLTFAASVEEGRLVVKCVE